MRRRQAVKRFRQPEAQQRIPQRVSRNKPVKFKQPDPPVQRFKVRTHIRRYRQPSPEEQAQASIIRPSTTWEGPDAHLRSALLAAVAGEHLTAPLIAVLVPVLSRPHRVQQLVDSFRAATSPADAELYFVAQASDAEEVAAIRAAGFEPILVDDANKSWARKINRGFESTREPWLLLGADDLKFHRGWVDAVRKLLSMHEGVIGTNDLGNPSTMSGVSSTHSLVRRKYAQFCGTVDERNRVLHEGYAHNFPDSELVHTAKRRGLYVHCFRCYVEHLHPAWGKGAMDDVYAQGQSTFHVDSALFSARGRQFGWA